MLGRVPPGWGARELAVVESFLSRAGTLEDKALVRRMAERILGRHPARRARPAGGHRSCGPIPWR